MSKQHLSDAEAKGILLKWPSRTRLWQRSGVCFYRLEGRRNAVEKEAVA